MSFTLNRAKSGKLDTFKLFRFEFFLPTIFWSLVVCVVKMWSDRKKKQKKFLVPRLLGITHGKTTGGPAAAGCICAQND